MPSYQEEPAFWRWAYRNITEKERAEIDRRWDFQFQVSGFLGADIPER
ncbi:MAG: hypothetical protein V3W37_03135 [Candidatus Binatia bacterium]